MISHPAGVSIGGGDSPILPGVPVRPATRLEEHLVIAVVLQVGVNDSHMFALEPGTLGTGRWISAQRSPLGPGNFRGKNAASLSSGGMIGPRRSNVLKSRVIASATIGPLREKAV